MRQPNSLIGSAIERVEDLRFLRGRGTYVGDMNRPGQLHAVILRSSVAHGLIRRIDKAAALALPGMHAVITAADLGTPVPTVPVRLQPLPALEPFRQPMLADGKVRYVGEPIAVLVADSPAIAEDAADLLRIEIDPLPPIASRAQAEAGESLLFEAHGTNAAIGWTARKGDVDRVFAAADYRRRESFRVQRHAALFMEPRGFVAEWNGSAGRLTIWGAAKVAWTNRRFLAGAMALDESDIDMIELDVGGGFGSRGEFYPEDFLIPAASRLTKRPVKWIEDRREHLMCANHAREVECDIEIAATRDGRLLGLRGSCWADIGAYLRTNGSVAPRNIAQFLAGPYRIEALDVTSTMLLTNKTPAGTYRGPGRFEADFVRERLLDLMAGDLGLDRIDLRRKNLVSDDEMPYAVASITPYESVTELDSGDYPALLERCLAEFGWHDKRIFSGREIDGRRHGIGLGCFIEGGAAGPKEDARLVLETDGSLSVYLGSSAVGQGIETIMAQIAADAMELPFDRIRVLHGSTSHVQEGYGSYHSRSTVMGGSAILLAAEKLKARIREVAAARFNCDAGSVALEGDMVRSETRTFPIAGLSDRPIEAEASFHNKKYTYAYGTAAAHVAVDAGTGEVRLLDYVSVADVGRIVNPLTLTGQAVGGIVQGLGGALLEHLVYDEAGQLLTGSLADYLLPTASDFPDIRAIMLELKPSPNNPLGAKGGGEGGIIPVGGVIANAVADALSGLGVQPFALPLSPPRVWQLIDTARAARRPA